MSYGRLAWFCSIGSAVVSALFSGVMMAITLGPGYLPVAAAVVAITGLLAYLTIWLAWTINSEKLARKGHRW